MSALSSVSRQPAGQAHPGLYARVLGFAFAAFNGVRVLTYLPTIWAICTSGDSHQHSLVTWLTWLGANATMAAWMHEKEGGRVTIPVLVNLGNALMCSATIAVILWFRS